MVPCAEHVPAVDFAPFTAKKNVTFAVNYEVSMFERSSHVESVPKSTKFVDGPNFVPSRTKCEAPAANKSVNILSPSMPRNVEMREISSSTTNCTPTTTTLSGKSTRRSNRGQKRKDVPLERHRVRYDMELVPPARRNRLFLQNFPAWWSQPKTTTMQYENEKNEDSFKLRRSSRRVVGAEALEGPSTEMKKSAETKLICSCAQSMSDSNTVSSPFEEDSSVVWIPSKRSEWEDSVSEMTAVCTSASLRRHVAANSQQPFVAPLSREYIRDRVDIDDPLNGYQIRHKTGGWMQGFILWTNFTTWTQYFKFDSLHSHSGITLPATDKVDADGSLSAELEAQPKSGDPYVGGVVFDTIAEIGLLGAIGCGEHLLRMALDDIMLHHGDKYKYVVLQATDGSKSFYERFGFIRVGAVCRYRKGEGESEIVGYRHWTNANESERSLLMHGGPSYLMALKLPTKEERSLCGSCFGQMSIDDAGKPLSFLDEMKKYAVSMKPKIEQLGAAATPAPKATRRKSLGMSKKRAFDSVLSSPGATTYAKSSYPSPPGNRPTTEVATTLYPVALPTSDGKGERSVIKSPAQAPVDGGERRLDHGQSEAAHRDKRQKFDGATKFQSLDQTSTSSKTGASSWAQKQYESVWLAVPPKMETSTSGRKPPRDRSLSKQSEVGAENRNVQRSATPGLIAPTSEFQVPNSNVTSSRFSQFSSPRTIANLQIKPERFHEEKVDARFSSSRALQPLSTDSGKGRKQKKAAPFGKHDSSAATKLENNSENGKDSHLDKGALYKQKMKSYPRDRIHFYNKVVRQKSSTGPSARYYFVLHYDEKEHSIRIVPLQVSGVLTGTRAGRPRWKAVLEGTDHNFHTVSTADYVPVEAKMVMKTPLVAVEAWDILDA